MDGVLVLFIVLNLSCCVNMNVTVNIKKQAGLQNTVIFLCLETPLSGREKERGRKSGVMHIIIKIYKKN